MRLICKWPIARMLIFAVGALSMCLGLAQGQASVDAKSMVPRDAKTSDTPEALSPVEIPSTSTQGQQELFKVRYLKKLTLPYREAKKVYFTACTAVGREFGNATHVRPRFTLVLGAKTDVVNYPARELQLKKWDKYMFAQGVVLLAFEDLLPLEEKKRLTKLAINWADATVDVGELKGTRAEDTQTEARGGKP